MNILNPFEDDRELDNINAEFKKTEKKIEKLDFFEHYSGNDRVISSIEMSDYIYGLSKDKREIRIMSGISELDEAIKGFYGGELTIISGETGNGKTLFAQTLTQAMVKQELKSLWFTFEVGPEQFFKQFDEPVPIFFLPMELKVKSLRWLEERILEAKLKYQVVSVFVDHLHFLIDLQRGSNMSLEIGFVMRELKRIALRYNVAFFLLAHTNRLKLEGEPDVDSLRDSAMIGCEADNVLFLWRLRNTANQAMLKIAKNRRYGIYQKKIRLQKQGKYLVEGLHESNYQD